MLKWIDFMISLNPEPCPKVPGVLLISAKANAGYNIAPPLGLYQIEGALKEGGVPVDMCDRELVGHEEYLERTRAGAYAIIGMSVSHDQMSRDLDMLWEFRAAAVAGGHQIIVVGGGQEATMNRDQWLQSGVDLIFLGYSEYPFTTFCKRFLADMPFDDGCWNIDALVSGIDGVAWENSNGRIESRPAPPIDVTTFRDLCYTRLKKVEIPYMVYWDQLRQNAADTSLGSSKFVIENVRLYTSSHCPRGCGFCNSQTFLASASDGPMAMVMLSDDEISDLVLMAHDRYGAKGVLFSDDDFPIGNRAGINRLRGFCGKIIDLKAQGRIDPDFTFACQGRVMDFVIRKGEDGPRVDMETIDLMDAAGFTSIGMGVETFCDRVMRAPSISKGAATNVECRMVVDAFLATKGVSPQINIILGAPEYDPAELADTIKIAVDYIARGCDVAVTPFLLALPGAPLIGRPGYEVKTTQWTHPQTGAIIDIGDYFEPHHPVIAEMTSKFEKIVSELREHVIQRHGWEGKIVHKRVYGLTALSTAARLIGYDDIADMAMSTLDDILELPKAS